MPGLPQQRPCPQPVPPALTRGSGRAHSPKPHVVPRVCLPISEREGRSPSPSAREDVVGARCPVPGAWLCWLRGLGPLTSCPVSGFSPTHVVTSMVSWSPLTLRH